MSILNHSKSRFLFCAFAVIFSAVTTYAIEDSNAERIGPRDSYIVHTPPIKLPFDESLFIESSPELVMRFYASMLQFEAKRGDGVKFNRDCVRPVLDSSLNVFDRKRLSQIVDKAVAEKLPLAKAGEVRRRIRIYGVFNFREYDFDRKLFPGATSQWDGSWAFLSPTRACSPIPLPDLTGGGINGLYGNWAQSYIKVNGTMNPDLVLPEDKAEKLVRKYISPAMNMTIYLHLIGAEPAKIGDKDELCALWEIEHFAYYNANSGELVYAK